MKQKKPFFTEILLISLLVVLLLTGCAKTPTTPQVPDAPGTEVVTPQPPVQTEPSPEQPENQPTLPDDQTPQVPEVPQIPETASPAPLQILLGRHYDSEYAEDFTLLCSTTWNSLLLGQDSAAAFPALSASLQQRTVDDYNYNKQFISEMLPYAKEASANNGEYFYGFTSDSAYYIQRADDRIFSVRLNEDEYTGGVHPNYWVIGLNLDPATGERLSLSDVLTDVAELPAILTQKIQTKYPFEPFPSLSEQLADYSADTYTWTLDYQGITFYFSPYEIASYAAGLLTANIWFDEMPELFVEEYTAAPKDGWVKMLPFHSDMAIDLHGSDDVRDSLYLSLYQPEGELADVHLTRNQKQYHLAECHGYTMKPLLVCTGEDRYFLYVEATAENDYTSLYIYDLNGDEVTLACALSNAGFTGIWEESLEEYGTWYEEVPTSPATVVLDSTLHILGTWTGSRTYTADPVTGALQPLTEHYAFRKQTIPIVSAVELSVTLLPQQETVTLPAGTGFFCLRTDGESYVDLKLEDGQECRIVITRENYTPLINGIPEWDCFIDLIYAG